MSLPRCKIQISVGKDQHCRGGLKSKINSIIGKQQPNVFLQVQKLKEKVELVTWQLKSRNLEGLVKDEERLT
jgi:hypothetical protein